MWRSLFWIFLLSCGGGNPLERAQADLAVGNWADAEANFRKALDDHPDSVEALYGLGWVYHLNGSSSRARDYFMRCLRVNAEDYRGYKGLGSLALGEGNFVVAVQRFNDALQRKPNDPAVLNSMSLVHLGSGQFEKARELLMPLVLQYPTRGELSLNLAPCGPWCSFGLLLGVWTFKIVPLPACRSWRPSPWRTRNWIKRRLWIRGFPICRLPDCGCIAGAVESCKIAPC
jgi:Flp pilus assembly protein TadD